MPGEQLVHTLDPAIDEYLPSEQSEHAIAGLLEYEPVGQLVQLAIEMEPGSPRVVLPGKQLVQTVDAATDEYKPFEQSEHPFAGLLEYEPMGQLVQLAIDVNPSEGSVVLPMRQEVQAVEPDADANEPRGQATQAIVGCHENLPMGQATQAEGETAAISSWTFPYVHGEQRENPVPLEYCPAAHAVESSCDDVSW